MNVWSDVCEYGTRKNKILLIILWIASHQLVCSIFFFTWHDFLDIFEFEHQVPIIMLLDGMRTILYVVLGLILTVAGVCMIDKEERNVELMIFLYFGFLISSLVTKIYAKTKSFWLLVWVALAFAESRCCLYSADYYDSSFLYSCCWSAVTKI